MEIRLTCVVVSLLVYGEVKRIDFDSMRKHNSSTHVLVYGMAAEVWLALQDGSRSCLDRMKLASSLWKEESVREKKWPLLVKWALDEVCKVYNRKAKSRPPREVCGQLWQLLAMMLQSITTSGVEIWQGEASPSVHFFQVGLFL